MTIGSIIQFNNLKQGSIEVTSNYSPELFALIQSVASLLSMPTPQVYLVDQLSIPCASVGFIGKKFVLITPALVESLSYHELAAVLGFQFSRIKCGHIPLSYFISAPIWKRIPGVSHLLTAACARWTYQTILTNDRASLLSSRRLDSTLSSIVRLTLGRTNLSDTEVQKFTDEQDAATEGFLSNLKEAFTSKPSWKVRIQNLKLFRDSTVYANRSNGSA